MERFLKDLFDFQRYQPNAKLEKLIEETRSRYGMLSDDDLEFVNAAGDADMARARSLTEDNE